MTTPPDTAPPTPPQRQTPDGTIGSVPTQQVVMGEVLRGLGTHGTIAGIILYVLQEWIGGLEARIDTTQRDLAAQVAEVRTEVGAVSAAVQQLRVDVVRLEVQQDQTRPRP